MPRSPPPPLSAASPPSSSSSSAVIIIIIISSAIIVSLSLYLLLRLLSRRCRRNVSTFSVTDDVIDQSVLATSAQTYSLVASLPSFAFGSVAGTLTGADCAVCLSKFERSDQLRLLPLCCHAFHQQCVDTWLSANLTCPLCRSTVHPTEQDVLDKILSQTNRSSNNSFRVEIGSVSRRRENSGERRSYSVGEFDYIIDNGYEVPIESMNHHIRRGSEDKEISFAPSAPPEELAAAVGGSGRSWLRDYVDRLTTSGRFFTGSSRRSEAVVGEETEGYRVGEEISELFRWLSGV